MRLPILCLCILACPVLVAAQSPGDLIISEIMQNPNDVTDAQGEWFEVFNTTSQAIDLNGWTIRDLGIDDHTISRSVVVPADGFAVLCRNADSATNGGFTCDYEYAGVTLANGDDEVILESTGGTEIDRVVYDGGPLWPDPTGASMVFTGTPAADNNDPNNWATALERQAAYGAGNDYGSPGSAGGLQGALPVELIAFDALVHGDVVVLEWTTASELNNAGFEVQRSPGTESFEPLGFVEGHGTTSASKHYTYRAQHLSPGRHVFRLKQVDFDGAFDYSPEIEVTLELEETFYLSDAYPNPFNPTTRFTVTVTQRQDVTVEVYTLLGQRVRLLFEGSMEAHAPHTVTFDAGSLPSGLYLYRVTGTSFTATKPVTLLK